MSGRAEQPAVAGEVTVTIDGSPWRFVVRADETYTLLDPDGRAVPPMDYLPRDEIDRLIEEAKR